MIREKYNLKCRAGHYHYAPEPKLWKDRMCLKPFEDPLRKDGYPRVTGKKCEKPLRILR